MAAKLPRNALIEKFKTPITVTSRNSHQENNSTNGFDEADSDSIYRLPSPDEVTEALAQEYPASFIPIDVSSFQRMSSFRRSLIHGDQEIPRRRISSRGKRTKRRNTIHETNKSATTERPSPSKYKLRERRNSDPSSLNQIDESCQTERTIEAIYSTGRIVNLKEAKRRSFGGTKLECRAEVHREDDRSDIFSGSVITVKSIGSSSLIEPNSSTSRSNSNSIGVGRSPNSVHDPSSSSLLTTSDVSGTSGTTVVEKKSSTQLPSAVEVKSYLSSNGIKMRDGPSAKGPGDDGRSSSGNWSASSSTHASVDSDHVSSGKCNIGVCRRNQRGQENCPPPGSPSGSSLGKDSVLSESLTLTTQQDTDRGCYMAADSNGYVSDTSAISSSYAMSRLSGLEKSREDPQYSAICGEAVIKRSTKSGLPTASTRTELNGRSIRFANRDSESWLKYFDGSTETLTPDITNDRQMNMNTNGSKNRYDMHKQNSKLLSPMSPSNSESSHSHHHPHHHRSIINHQRGTDFLHIDDEVESVYSVDTDGYYTSMHTDSGLFRDSKLGSVNIVDDSRSRVASSSENDTITSPGTSSRGGVKSHRNRASSVSSNSTIGDMSLTSMYSKTDTESGITPVNTSNNASSFNSSDQVVKKPSPVKPSRAPVNKDNDSCWSRVAPPPPPVRVSSIRKTNGSSSKYTFNSNNNDNNSYSNSEHQRPKSLELGRGSTAISSNQTANDFGFTSINVISNPPDSSRSQSRSSTPSIRNHSESEQSDKLGERVRSKTCIGSTDYPSLCNVTSSSSASSSSDVCDQHSSNGTSSNGSIGTNDVDKQSSNREKQSASKKEKSKKKLFGSYKPFKIKEIFSFGTLNKKSKITPVICKDREGFMAYESISTDPKGESDVRCPSRRSSGCESVPGCTSRSINGLSTDNLYKPQSIEKNLATLKKVDSNPYLPKPITDQVFFQSLLRSDFRSKSEEEIENDKNRTYSNKMEPSFPSKNESNLPQNLVKPKKVTNFNLPQMKAPEGERNENESQESDSNQKRPSTLILPYKIKQQQVKVELDSNGRVLYPSNSLGRRRDDHPMAYLERAKKLEAENKKWSTLPRPSVEDACLISPRAATVNTVSSKNRSIVSHDRTNNNRPSQPTNSAANASLTESLDGKENENSQSKLQQDCSPPKLVAPSPLSSTPYRPLANIQVEAPNSETPSTVVTGRVGPPTFPKPRFNMNRHSFSGLGSIERRAQDALNVNISPVDPALQSDLPSPIGTLLSSGSVRSKLSTSDLISMIYDSKRKLEKRSAETPSPITSPQSEPLPSPPNLLSPNQRRSWSFTKEMTNGFDVTVPGCRRSLASDRLGPVKPTSIHDFKKLIAAARPVGSTQKSTVSAKDLLQASPISTISSVNSRPSTPLTSMTNHLLNEMSQSARPSLTSTIPSSTTSSLSLSISPSSLPSPPSSTSSSSLASPQSPPSLSPSTGQLSSHLKAPTALRDSRTRIINGRIYRSPYRLEVMCPPIEEDAVQEESIVNNYSVPTELKKGSTSNSFENENNYRKGLSFIGSKEMEKHLISAGMYNNPSLLKQSPSSPSPSKATSTWV
uniref:WASP family protein member n=1 Tax=Tetranychus urticae TaxID=32264 RepID=T1KA97_TETUR